MIKHQLTLEDAKDLVDMCVNSRKSLTQSRHRMIMEKTLTPEEEYKMAQEYAQIVLREIPLRRVAQRKRVGIIPAWVTKNVK